VTFDEYDRFARATDRPFPSDQGWGRGNRPVVNVSWDDVTAYADWLSRRTGHRYRLPTEAEWEYAARAETKTPFWTGDCISNKEANFDARSDYANCKTPAHAYQGRTLPVGSLPPNPWGLNEVLGNVWEWTCSAYAQEYDGGEQRCKEGGATTARVRRGGSWSNPPSDLRSSRRYSNWPSHKTNDAGFRLAGD
jgi:formylglycine-generating enzyme required for sulfatase activity